MKNINMYTIPEWVESFDGKSYVETDNAFSGELYKKFISKCFEYSSCFSLIYRINEMSPFPLYDNRNIYSEYNDCIVKAKKTNKWPGMLETGVGGLIRYYQCCDKTYAMLTSIADSVFKFAYMSPDYLPEDLCFYRSDGTVLFASTVHEGECYLFPREDEDFDEILSMIIWHRSECSKEQYDKGFNDLAIGMKKEDFLK